MYLTGTGDERSVACMKVPRPLLFRCCVACACALVFASRAGAQVAQPSKAMLEADGPPLVTAWTPPVYPDELKREKPPPSGSVTVNFIVSETGAVSGARAVKSSDRRFEEAAVASVEKWVCSPGVDSGKPVAMSVSATLFFKWPAPKTPPQLPPMESLPRMLPKTSAQPVSQPDRVDFPPWIVERIAKGGVVADLQIDTGGKVSGVNKGSAKIEFIINSAGRACLPRVVEAAQPEFGWAAAAALNQWIFAPPMRDGKPAGVRVQAPFDFGM